MIQRVVNKIVLIALLLVSFSINSFSQEENMKWALKTSYSLLWYNGELGSQFLNFGERSDGAKVSFAKYLSPSFDVEMGLEYFRLNLSGDINSNNYTSKGNVFAPSLALNYKFNNNYILPVSAKVKPYLGVGFNYLIGQVKGIGYNLEGDVFTHFVDEVALNTSIGAKYYFTKRIGAFVELNSVLATTEELDGAAIDMNNDLFGGIRIGLIVKISREKDQDHDGVPDIEDECPDTPEGVKVDEKGCPLDRDKDGIPDFEDDCPDDPGLPEYNGCPDTDGDGIIDKIDDCPELPGIPKYNGCPDTDGDGVIDPNDLCPDTQAGVVVDEYGCPIDSDGDGLYDAVDQCPDEYGPTEYMGCPEPPDVGWPSTENDTPPEVYFETDQFELDPIAEDEMQKMVKYLFENPNMNIRLYGSADPRGTKEYNAVLSARRVEAVKKFLLRKGVPENRIMVKALGETQEIKTSKKEEGVSEDQRLKKYRKVLFQTYFFMH